MKITQDSPTYLECKKSALFGYIFSIIQIIGGLIGVIAMIMKSSSQWWIGLIAVAIGILILFLTKSITLIADGNLKQVKIATKSLLGASNHAYAFHDINEIVIEEDWQYERDSDGGRKDKTNFVLIFNFHNGYQEAIDISSSSSDI